MTVNFQHLRAFYAVAIDRNMSRAARRLNISQSTISKQIKELEQRYQVKLVQGHHPPLSLTPAGIALYEKARGLFALADDIGALLGEATGDNRALIRLGTDSPPHAAAFMAAYLDEQPKTDFKVTVDNARATNDLLLAAQIDLGIICEPFVHPDYSYIPLYEDRLVALVPADWPHARDGRFRLPQLAKETLLVREHHSRTLVAIQAMLSEANITPGRILDLHTREMIREAVARNIGVTFQFRQECPPDKRMKILEIDASSKHILVNGYLAFQTERKKLSSVKAAIRTAKAIFSLANSQTVA